MRKSPFPLVWLQQLGLPSKPWQEISDWLNNCRIDVIRLIRTGSSLAVSVRPFCRSSIDVRHPEPVVGPGYQTSYCCVVSRTYTYFSPSTAWRVPFTLYYNFPSLVHIPVPWPRDNNWRRRPRRQTTCTAWMNCLQITTLHVYMVYRLFYTGIVWES